MILQDIINEFNSSEEEVINIFKEGLKATRGTYTQMHHTSGKTADNIEMTDGRIQSNYLVWYINSKTGFFLQKGGEVPYTDNAGGERSGNDSAYINAIITWVGRKYKKFGPEAKRLAFKIANAARERNGNIVKHTGWVDDIRPNILSKTSTLISEAVDRAVDFNLSKLPKNITTNI